MGHTLNNASSHLPSISAESDGIQETDLISVIFQKKKRIENNLLPPPPALSGGEQGYIRNQAFPLSSLGKIWEALSILWVWSSSKKNNRTIRPLVVVLMFMLPYEMAFYTSFPIPPSYFPGKIHPLKNAFHVPSQFPFSLLSFLKKI